MGRENSSTFRYNWFGMGDINGFFGLMFDNMTVLAFMAGILIFAFGFPAEIIYKKMFPGTALGVLVGDVVYTIMAFRLAKKTKNPNVTAMPLGLDTPSSIGMALSVLGPAFIAMKSKGMSVMDAAHMTWYIGMATMMVMGFIKLVFSFFGSWIQKVVPQAGLLGSLAGIGLALIGFMPLVEIFGMPIVGLVALGLVLYSLIAKIRLPFGLPGVFVSVGLGTLLYYILGPMGLGGGHFVMPKPEFYVGFPMPTLGFLQGMGEALKYLPIAIPFSILTVIGGVNVTESARVAGDDYNTRNILLTEAIATLIAGLFGGVAQSTPYIGQPAYKKMGARAGYTLMTGIFIGLGGILGYAGFIVELIPKAVIAPILVFVAIDIIEQSFIVCPRRHIAAIAFAFFPSIARLVQIKLSNPELVPMENFAKMMTAEGRSLPDLLTIVALGNGFILTAMLWGAFIAKLIDRKLKESAFYLLICGVLTMFGIIHSATADGTIYFPWQLAGMTKTLVVQFTLSYFVLALLFFCLSYSKGANEPIPEDFH